MSVVGWVKLGSALACCRGRAGTGACDAGLRTLRTLGAIAGYEIDRRSQPTVRGVGGLDGARRAWNMSCKGRQGCTCVQRMRCGKHAANMSLGVYVHACVHEHSSATLKTFAATLTIISASVELQSSPIGRHNHVNPGRPGHW